MGTLRTAITITTRLQKAMLITGVGCVFFAGLACGALVERTVKHFKTPTNTSISTKVKPVKPTKRELINHPIATTARQVSRLECIKGYLFVLSSNGDIKQVFKQTQRSTNSMPMACKAGDK